MKKGEKERKKERNKKVPPNLLHLQGDKRKRDRDKVKKQAMIALQEMVVLNS